MTSSASPSFTAPQLTLLRRRSRVDAAASLHARSLSARNRPSVLTRKCSAAARAGASSAFVQHGLFPIIGRRPRATVTPPRAAEQEQQLQGQSSTLHFKAFELLYPSDNGAKRHIGGHPQISDVDERGIYSL